MTTREVGTIPLRVLLVLTAAVGMAHVLVVQETRLSLAPGDHRAAPVFSTRVLTITPDPTPVRPAIAQQAKAPAARGTPVAAARARPEPPAAATEPPPPPEPAQEPVAQAVPARPEPAASAPPPPAPALVVAETAPATTTPSATTATTSLPKDPAQVTRSYAVPGSVRLKLNATGQASRMPYQARGELAWLHDGKSYEATLQVDIIFRKRVWTSTGQVTADGLAPNRYSDRFRSELAAHFDRDRGRVTFSANTPESVLLPGAQDQLSVFIQLAAMVAGEPARYPAGSSISVQAVGSRMAEPWVFVVEGEETVSPPGGSMTALKLTRAPRREFDRKVELWLAPSLSYLPARILLTDTSGDFVDLQWRATEAP